MSWRVARSPREFHEACDRLPVHFLTLVTQVVQGHDEHGLFQQRQLQAGVAQLFLDREENALQELGVHLFARVVLVWGWWWLAHALAHALGLWLAQAVTGD